ncbi:RHS repeat-associated core domain-containing protein [Paenarthrobacter sp. PH39-S1]|uniref:RHS repeat-associated core domain-containing protein n=1 Tax=Paenarthrobacter sp. PH39-S1 TaxID=3046204 RepID=UPI0024B98855|nr:RHS repeat-associated core domain-containing protein [Paenarthrobacter sp. PH39-S1]MDJ0358577.1 RHS repeat-associated core domain-containing protein [Paenarthrobacter sp. PH39-S1]
MNQFTNSRLNLESTKAGTLHAYDPYGVQTITKDTGGNATDQTPYTFKQGLQDRTTGWVKYGARWYNPTTGRWTQQDTLDNPLDPANANRYTYAANDPINNADPTGMDFFSDFGQQFAPVIVAGAVGLLGTALGVAVDSTGIGLGITLGIGCATGLATVAVSDSLNGSNTSAGGYLGACAGGAIIGAAGFGIGSAVLK